jgi:hypothetical protein
METQPDSARQVEGKLRGKRLMGAIGIIKDVFTTSPAS